MKVCLKAWQDKEYLDKADEIKVIWEKREIIPQIFEEYPKDKVVILECFKTELTEEEWTDIKIYNGLSRGKFKICCADWKLFKDSSIPYYVGYPAYDLYTVEGLARAGVTEVRVGGPLIFDLKGVCKCLHDFNVKIRAVPNVAYIDGLPHSDGVLGGWIRPEDMESYEDYIDVIEFEDTDTKAKEQALYRIYIEDREYLGSLEDLITNLNYPGLNRMIPRSMSIARVNCRQECMRGSICQMCYRMLLLANPDLYRKIKKDE